MSATGLLRSFRRRRFTSHSPNSALASTQDHGTSKVHALRCFFGQNADHLENVLVTVTAASGATSNAAWASISLAELYYGTRIPVAVCLFFMWAIVYIGYAMAALARQFLLYDPIYTWPYALMQTAVFETMRKSPKDSWVARKQKYVFFGSLVFITLWQFLPEKVFPMLASLSFLCWVAPRNSVANFVGAGMGGMGVLNLSLDWSNISNQSLTNPMVVPFWTTVVLTVAFVVNTWILIPAAKWG